MFKNLKSFNRKINNFAKVQVPADGAKFFRMLALELLKGVVLDTPVDSGRAQGNWVLTLNAPFAGWQKDGPFKTPGQIVSEGLSTLKGFKLGNIIFLTNNVPYIVRLEQGWSDQAPSGMLERNMNRLLTIFRK